MQRKSIFVWSMTFFISGYFILHALGWGGEVGYFSLAQLDADIATAEQNLAGLTEYRSWLAHRVGLISQNSIDADFLGEIARQQSGLFAPDEIIIPLD